MISAQLKHNRPLHLARMLSYYERAMDLVFQPMVAADPRVRMSQSNLIVNLLKRAATHARFSTLNQPCIPEENEFIHFLNLSRQSALAIRAMLENEVELRADKGFISKFLRVKEDECATSAMHYLRRSEDLMQGLSHMMRLAQHPYCQMKKKLLDVLPPEDRDRFDRAREGVSERLFPAELTAFEQKQPVENTWVA